MAAGVAGYLRVSSAAQRDTSDSLASQKQRLEQAGADRFYVDAAVSGFRMEKRTGKPLAYNQLLADIAAGLVSKLITVRLDRIGRRDQLVLDLVDACEAAGIEFLSLNSGVVSTGTTSEWLSVRLQTMLSEHYSRQLSESIRAGYQGLIAAGIPARSSASLPVHLMRMPEVRHGVMPSPMWDDCRHVIEHFMTGECRLADAAAFLAERHQKLGHGRSVGGWLRGQHLLGHMARKDGTVLLRNCWPAICTPAEFEQIQLQLQENRRVFGKNLPKPAEEGGPRPPRKTRALSGLCSCAHCGSVLAYSVARRTSGNYSYLRCSQQQCASKRAGVRADHLEEALLMQALGDHLHLVALALAAADDLHIPSPELIELRQELRAREQLPAQFRTEQDHDRIRQLQQQIAVEQRTPAAPDPKLIALLDERLRMVPTDSSWGQTFQGQIDSDHWGWLSAPGMDRSEQQRRQDLLLLIQPGGVLVNTVPRDRHLWIRRVNWRLQVADADGEPLNTSTHET